MLFCGSLLSEAVKCSSNAVLLQYKALPLTASSETQIPTQRYGRRPYGVGLLIAGYDVSRFKRRLKVDCALAYSSS